MNIKLVKIASVREHMDAHYRDEISYSKAVDLINEDANKQLMLGGVSNRRELLIDFCQKVDETLEMYGHLAPNEAYIDEYLKVN